MPDGLRDAAAARHSRFKPEAQVREDSCAYCLPDVCAHCLPNSFTYEVPDEHAYYVPHSFAHQVPDLEPYLLSHGLPHFSTHPALHHIYLGRLVSLH